MPSFGALPLFDFLLRSRLPGEIHLFRSNYSDTNLWSSAALLIRSPTANRCRISNTPRPSNRPSPTRWGSRHPISLLGTVSRTRLWFAKPTGELSRRPTQCPRPWCPPVRSSSASEPTAWILRPATAAIRADGCLRPCRAARAARRQRAATKKNRLTRNWSPFRWLHRKSFKYFDIICLLSCWRIYNWISNLQSLSNSQDPPRLRNFAAKRFNLNSMLISPRRDAPPEGTRGTFRSLGEDVGSNASNGNQPNRSKPRPLSQEVCVSNFPNFSLALS